MILNKVNWKTDGMILIKVNWLTDGMILIKVNWLTDLNKVDLNKMDQL